MNEPDYVAAGFQALDVELPPRPKKIQWGRLYRDKTDAQKITYLEKLAASMNEAAAKIQGERDALGQLCELKEQQLIQQSRAVAANNEMLQAEMTKMNLDKQEILKSCADLRARVRELERRGD